jgi:hypothetical protein
MKKTMKKQTALTLALLIGLLSSQTMALSIDTEDLFTIPDDRLSDEPEVEKKLRGPEIEECQDISHTWRNRISDDAWNKFMGREIKEALDDAKSQLSGSSLGTLYEKDKSGKSCITSQSEGPCEIEGEDDAAKGKIMDALKKVKGNIPSAYGAYTSRVNRALNKVQKCLALYSVVSKARGKREMSFSEDNRSAKVKSFDGKLVCESQGYETQDYKACKESVTYYDGVFLGRKAVAVAQQFDYMDSSMDIQTDLAKNSQTDATAGLKAQQSDIEKRAEMARTRGATETAAALALWRAMEKIPTIDNLFDECKTSIKEDSYANAKKIATANIDIFQKKLNQIGQITAKKRSDQNADDEDLVAANKVVKYNEDNENNDVKFAEMDKNDACNEHVYDVGGEAAHAMINNSGAREVIQQALIDAGMNVATMMGTAEILDKQAGRVGDAIKLVDGHEPETLEYGGEDVLATECQINPSAPECNNIDNQTGVDYYNQGINVDGIQFATSDSTLPEDEFGNRSVDDSSGDTTRDGGPTGVGSTIAGVDKGGGLADDPIAAASVKATGTNGIGSGAGGGGGGGASAGAPPANGSAKGAGQDPKNSFVGSGSKIKFSGGGGALKFGSSSKRRAKKEKSKNPFANLFGKKGKKKGGVLNFRGMASVGKKKGSIFKMISNRYSIVNKEKRLLKYELEVNGDLPSK